MALNEANPTNTDNQTICDTIEESDHLQKGNRTPIHIPDDVIHGDKVIGDKVIGDKVIGDKIGGDKITINIESREGKRQEDLRLPSKPTILSEVTNFVGRETELINLGDILQKSRLVTITGMPGIGKTGLATTLALQSTDATAIFWYEFRENEAVEELIEALAGFLFWRGYELVWRMIKGGGRQLPSHRELFGHLLQDIEGQEYLLCFDNYQNIKDNSPVNDLFIKPLQKQAGRGEISLIISSRPPVPSFLKPYEYKIDGLSSEDIHNLLAKKKLSLSDKLIGNLHAHIEGNAQLLTLAMNAKEFQEDPEQFIGQLSRVESVKEYLISTVDKNLTKTEKIVMDSLSVLLGYPATQDAIEAVADCYDLGRVLHGLTSRNLLTVTSEGKYKQHDTIRDFYYRQLGKKKRVSMHQRVAIFFAQKEPLIAAQHYQIIGNPLNAGDNYFNGHAHKDAEKQYKEATRAAYKKNDVESYLLIKQKLGRVYYQIAEYENAVNAYREMADLQNTSPTKQAQTYYLMGKTYHAWGDSNEDALKYLDLGLKNLVGQNNESKKIKAKLLSVQCAVLSEIGNFEKAEKAGQKGLAIVKQIRWQTEHIQATLLNHLGVNASRQALAEHDNSTKMLYLNQALECYQQSYGLYQKADVKGYEIAQSLTNIGAIQDLLKFPAKAIRYYQRALEIEQRTGYLHGQASTYGNLGLAYMAQNKPHDAENMFNTALAVWERVSSDHRQKSLVYHDLGELYLNQEKYKEAENSLNQAINLYKKHNKRTHLSRAYLLLAQTYKATNKNNLADNAIESAITTARNDTERQKAQNFQIKLHQKQ